MALGFDSTAWTDFGGSLVFLDAHLYKPRWRRVDLGLPTGQGTLTALRTRKGGEGGEGKRKGRLGGGGNF